MVQETYSWTRVAEDFASTLQELVSRPTLAASLGFSDSFGCDSDRVSFTILLQEAERFKTLKVPFARFYSASCRVASLLRKTRTSLTFPAVAQGVAAFWHDYKYFRVPDRARPSVIY